MDTWESGQRFMFENWRVPAFRMGRPNSLCIILQGLGFRNPKAEHPSLSHAISHDVVCNGQ